MRNIPVLAVLAAGLAATPAMAQNTAPGGFYVGALGGYEGLDVESADGIVTANADSAVYGINAGYDLSLGSLFVGVEGELSASGGSTEFPDSFTGARTGSTPMASTISRPRRCRADLGIAAYGKIGYGARHQAFTSSGLARRARGHAGGLRFGGGVQVQLPRPARGTPRIPPLALQGRSPTRRSAM